MYAGLQGCWGGRGARMVAVGTCGWFRAPCGCLGTVLAGALGALSHPSPLQSWDSRCTCWVTVSRSCPWGRAAAHRTVLCPAAQRQPKPRGEVARDLPVAPEGEGIASCLTPPGFNEGREQGVTKAAAGGQVICVPPRRLPLCPREPSRNAERGLGGGSSTPSLELLPAAQQAATGLLRHCRLRSRS